ncbi:MAG: hypothetical protein J3K34DRAFT_409271 [Monoraphidium minutum]|nr:MAG: hypothetical protein J3K34DRAFT_409271 [Monoraphidium minutum]
MSCTSRRPAAVGPPIEHRSTRTVAVPSGGQVASLCSCSVASAGWFPAARCRGARRTLPRADSSAHDAWPAASSTAWAAASSVPTGGPAQSPFSSAHSPPGLCGRNTPWWPRPLDTTTHSATPPSAAVTSGQPPSERLQRSSVATTTTSPLTRPCSSLSSASSRAPPGPLTLRTPAAMHTWCVSGAPGRVLRKVSPTAAAHIAACCSRSFFMGPACFGVETRTSTSTRRDRPFVLTTCTVGCSGGCLPSRPAAARSSIQSARSTGALRASSSCSMRAFSRTRKSCCAASLSACGGSAAW